MKIEDYRRPYIPVETSPVNLYEISLSSADGKDQNILNKYQDKVTLVFNVAAGCGNIPQHASLELLNKRYKDVPDFNILAIVVDDFVCHGYPEFQNGLQNYIDTNKMTITPGQLSEKYARENWNVTYSFSELTNGRHDKHSYSEDYIPGSVNIQEQHPLWSYLTGAYAADLNENGVPYHNEVIPWSLALDNGHTPVPEGKRSFAPLTGNFQKFLIARDGRRFKRYGNGFLLGERNELNEPFPWNDEKYTEDGRQDYRPKHISLPIKDSPDSFFDNEGNSMLELKRLGVEISLASISEDIDEFLRD